MELENNETQIYSEIKSEMNELKEMYSEIMKTVNKEKSYLESFEDNKEKLFETLNSEKIKIGFGDFSFEILIKKLIRFKNSFFTDYIYNYYITYNTFPTYIFFDTNIKHVKKLANYLRTNIFNMVDILYNDREELLKIIYNLGLWELSNEIIKSLSKPQFFRIESGFAQSHTNTDLDIRNINIDNEQLNFGIYNSQTYEITFRLLYDVKAEYITIRGYRGKSINSNCGSGCIIHGSLDGVNYVNIGTIPTSYNENKLKIKLTSSIYLRYIKFKHTSQLGISFLDIDIIKSKDLDNYIK